MSSKSYEHKTRTRGTSYGQKINLSNDNNKRIRKKPILCNDCKDATNSIKSISNNVNKIEELVNNFYKDLPKNNTNKFSIFNAKFTLNNVPCELEYDLSNFSLENLHKLAIYTTQFCNNNSSDKNEEINDVDVDNVKIDDINEVDDVDEIGEIGEDIDEIAEIGNIDSITKNFAAYLTENAWYDEILGNLSV